MFMLRTWRFGGAVEGREGEGDVKGSSWAIYAAHALWVRLQASVRRM